MNVRRWARWAGGAGTGLKAATILALLTGLPASARSGERAPTSGPASSGVTVLDLERGSFIGYARWKTPSVVSKAGKIVPFLEPPRKDVKEEARKSRPAIAAEPPGKDWAAADFDDSCWGRVREPLVVTPDVDTSGMAGSFGLSLYTIGNPVEWGQVFLRGTFRIDDPAQAKDLKLSLRYYGGVVAYVNGQELGRAHLPQGALDVDTPAERYPEEAYLRPDGKVYQRKDAKEFADRMKARVRELGAPIPTSMLRKGVNVIALAAHAAPLAEWMYAYAPLSAEMVPWPHVGVLEARLSAAAGVTPNVGPSEAIGLWTSQPMETVEAWDYARPAERVLPIRLVGARNGTFSGKVVLSSKNSVRNLKAAVSDLAQSGAGGNMPASGT